MQISNLGFKMFIECVIVISAKLRELKQTILWKEGAGCWTHCDNWTIGPMSIFKMGKKM